MANKRSSHGKQSKPPPTSIVWRSRSSALRVRITLIVEFKMEDMSVAADIAGAVKGALEKLEEIGEVTRHDQEFLTARANA